VSFLPPRLQAQAAGVAYFLPRRRRVPAAPLFGMNWRLPPLFSVAGNGEQSG